MLETTRVHIVPSANPDGVTTALTQTDGQCNLTQGYTNSHNVDLDTDFKGNTSAVNVHVYEVYTSFCVNFFVHTPGCLLYFLHQLQIFTFTVVEVHVRPHVHVYRYVQECVMSDTNTKLNRLGYVYVHVHVLSMCMYVYVHVHNLAGHSNSTHRQPETRALMHWMEAIPFVLSINLHSGRLVSAHPHDDALSKLTTPFVLSINLHSGRLISAYVTCLRHSCLFACKVRSVIS